MIKNIVFDIGNVLLSFDPLEFLRDRVSDEDLINILHDGIFGSEEWLLLDRGLVSREDALRVFQERNLVHSERIAKTFLTWHEMLYPLEGNVELLQDLKKEGYKLYYLSNFPKDAFEYVLSRYGFFSLFDGGVVSYLEGSIKPEAKIYTALIERYSLVPSESLFIDDMKRNTDKALEMGFKVKTLGKNESLRNFFDIPSSKVLDAQK